MTNALQQEVRRIIARHLRVDVRGIALETHLRRDLGLDPLDLVLVALRLEDREIVEFPLDRLEAAETVGDLAEVVRNMRAKSAAEEAVDASWMDFQPPSVGRTRART